MRLMHLNIETETINVQLYSDHNKPIAKQVIYRKPIMRAGKQYVRYGGDQWEVSEESGKLWIHIR